MTHIINPWAGFAIGGDWNWHIKNNGGRGGTDYKVPANTVVHSPSDGIAAHLTDGLNTIVIALPDGRTIHMEENKSVIGTFPRHVTLGEPVAYTGLYRGGVVRWPHIHGQVGNTREPFDEPAIGPSWVINDTPVLTANQRLVRLANTRVRDVPFITGNVLGLLALEAVITVDGYTTSGSLADGTENWYHVTSPKVGWVNAALILNGLVTDNLKNMTPVPPVVTPPVVTPPVTITPIDPPVVTSPITGPVTTPPVVVIPPKESKPPVTVTPATNFNPAEADVLGEDLGIVANASLTPKGRTKLYTIMTRINGISAPVIVAGGAAAAFIRGQIGLDILIGVGVATVINNIVTSFTTKLAKNNVNK